MTFARGAVITVSGLAGLGMMATLVWINAVGNSRYRNRSYLNQPIHYCRRMSDPRNATQLASVGLKPESYVHCMKWDLDADRGDEAVTVDLAKLTNSEPQ